MRPRATKTLPNIQPILLTLGGIPSMTQRGTLSPSW
jgi:hypothetical protein